MAANALWERKSKANAAPQLASVTVHPWAPLFPSQKKRQQTIWATGDAFVVVILHLLMVFFLAYPVGAKVNQGTNF